MSENYDLQLTEEQWEALPVEERKKAQRFMIPVRGQSAPYPWQPWRKLTDSELVDYIRGNPCPICGKQLADARPREVPGVQGVFVKYVLPDGRWFWPSEGVPSNCPHLASHYALKHFIRYVPDRYKKMRFAMQPSELAFAAPLDFQRRVIDTVESHYHDSFLFAGPPGCGKTAISTAIYRKVLEDAYDVDWAWKPPVWKLTLSKFITDEREYRKYQTEDSEERSDNRLLTIDMIEEARYFKPAVFLEEFDKLGNITEFRAEMLFALVNTLYSKRGQLVIDTNLTLEKLESFFAIDDNYDGTLPRRFAGMCWRIDYWNKAIMPPKEDKPAEDPLEKALS